MQLLKAVPALPLRAPNAAALAWRGLRDALRPLRGAPVVSALSAALQRQVMRCVDQHLQRHPGALGVVFDGPLPSATPAARWMAGVETDARRWWVDIGLPRRRGEPPMCLLQLAPADPQHAWALCREVADSVPSGSLLLLAVSDRALLQCLRDPSQLRTHHRRLRLDRLHRPHALAGGLWPAWGLACELWRGQPPLALCELGIDP